MRQEESSVDPTGHALVLDEASSVQQWMQDQGIALKKGAPNPYAFSTEGWHAGHDIALQDAVVAADKPSNPTLRGKGIRRSGRWK
jgi:hypothetical protein